MNLSSTFIRLRPDASTEALAVDETFWRRIASGELGKFHGEFLIATSAADHDWLHWEMHPNGDEIVCLLSGSATFLLQETDANREIELADSGAFVIVPRGTWHTARIHSPARMLFITPGEGTQHRPL